MKISGYNLALSDHPSIKNRGGVCIYFKNYLPLRVRVDVNYLNKFVRFQQMITDKMCNFITLCWSPSQSQDLFESFKENLELNLESVGYNIFFLVVVLNGFNTKSSNWCKTAIAIIQGKAMLTLALSLHQPAHILESFFHVLI